MNGVLRRGTAALLVCLLPVGCDVGSGSRVPPFLPGAPSRFLTGVVQDTGGNAVVGARIELDGVAETVVTMRSGRFLLPEVPTGTHRLTVDGSAATATGNEAFGRIAVAVEVPEPKAELTRALVLPDLAAGSSRLLSLGVQPQAVTIDGSTTSGAVLAIQAGTIVTLDGSAQGQADVNLARIDETSLPRVLPSGGALLTTRGIQVSPLGIGFTAGARLSLPNDLRLPNGGGADLYRIEPAGGTWVVAGRGTVNGSTITLDAADLPGGGLYVFAVPISTMTFVSGRVVDADGKPIPGARVSAGAGLAEISDKNGNYRIGPLPAVDGAGRPLTLSIVTVPPLSYAPFRGQKSVTAIPSQTLAGDLAVDTFRSGLSRFLITLRGRAQSLRRVVFGGPRRIGAARLSDAEGVGEYREVVAGWHSAYATWVEEDRLFRGVVSNELRVGDLTVDLQVLARQEDPWPDILRGKLLALVLDAEFASPLRDVSVQGRGGSTTNDKGLSGDLGEAVINAGSHNESTAAYESEAGGQTVRSAFTVCGLDNARAEFPLRVASGRTVGSFDCHTLLTGTMLQAASGAKTRKLLVRPRYSENDLWNRMLTGRTFAGDLPRKTDPDKTGGTSYVVGLPTVQGYVTALEGVVQAGGFVPEKVGFLTDLATEPGMLLVRDVVLEHAWDRTVTLSGALATLDPPLNAMALRYDLGARRPDASALDLLDDAGGVQTSGNDVILPVPARAGALQSVTWLIEVGATGIKSGATITQRIFAATDQSTLPAPSFLAVPEITSPLPNTTVASASEVTVTWKPAPAGTAFLELRLESVAGNDTRTWTVYLPPEQTSYKFQKLVPAAPEILAPKRSWNLVLRAARVDRGIVVDRGGYQRLIGNLFSIRPGERGIAALSSTEFSFSTP